MCAGELIDDLSLGERPSEYAVLFTQVNAITAAEGNIGGTAGYTGPVLMCARCQNTSAFPSLHALSLQRLPCPRSQEMAPLHTFFDLLTPDFDD